MPYYRRRYYGRRRRGGWYSRRYSTRRLLSVPTDPKPYSALTRHHYSVQGHFPIQDDGTAPLTACYKIALNDVYDPDLVAALHPSATEFARMSALYNSFYVAASRVTILWRPLSYTATGFSATATYLQTLPIHFYLVGSDDPSNGPLPVLATESVWQRREQPLVKHKTRQMGHQVNWATSAVAKQTLWYFPRKFWGPEFEIEDNMGRIGNPTAWEPETRAVAWFYGLISDTLATSVGVTDYGQWSYQIHCDYWCYWSSETTYGTVAMTEDDKDRLLSIHASEVE